MTRAELWARRLPTSGRTMRPSTFYHAFLIFGIIVIAQQIFARFHQGLTKDSPFAQLGDALRLLGDRGVGVFAATDI